VPSQRAPAHGARQRKCRTRLGYTSPCVSAVRSSSGSHHADVESRKPHPRPNFVRSIGDQSVRSLWISKGLHVRPSRHRSSHGEDTCWFRRVGSPIARRWETTVFWQEFARSPSLVPSWRVQPSYAHLGVPDSSSIVEGPLSPLRSPERRLRPRVCAAAGPIGVQCGHSCSCSAFVISETGERRWKHPRRGRKVIDRSHTPAGESAAQDAESAKVLNAIRGML